jgi:hypothetical protein
MSSWSTPLQQAASAPRGGPRPAGAIRPAAAGGAGAAAAPERVAEVHVDGLVVLKIIKHCRDAFPENVAGTLLGFEKDDGQGGPPSGTLEVTHAFPMPMDDSEDANVGYDQRYEVRMIKALKEINVDQTTVGWYSSNFLSSFFTPDTIQHHARYQLTVPSAVLLVYDNIRTNQGHLALRALRLTPAAMSAYRAALAEVQRSGRGAGLDEERLGKAVLGSEAFVGLSPASVFESLPVRVRNPHLLQALLVDLVDRRSMMPVALGKGGLAATAEAAAAAGTIGGAALRGGQGLLASAAAVSPSAAAVAAGLPPPAGAPTVSAAASAAAASAAVAAAAAAASSSAAAEGEDTDFARLSLSTVPYLEKHLEALNFLMEEVAKVQDSQSYVIRKAQRMQREREEWVARRRKENDARQQQGLAALPEVDFSLPFFQQHREKGAKDPLEGILYAAQINSYCGAVARFSYDTFPKLFLANAMAESVPSAAGAV